MVCYRKVLRACKEDQSVYFDWLAFSSEYDVDETFSYEQRIEDGYECAVVIVPFETKLLNVVAAHR